MTIPALKQADDWVPASLCRRLAAAGYDTILCLALLVVATALYKLTQMAWYGEPRLRTMSESGVLDHDPLLSTLLLSLPLAFFAGFWTRTGQTLGMQAWGIRVQNGNGSAISVRQALLRCLTAIASWLCLGMGWWWMLFDSRQCTWHDLGSRSQVVRVRHKKTDP